MKVVPKQWGEGLWILTMTVLCWTFAAVLGWHAYIEEMQLGGTASSWLPVTATIVESSLETSSNPKCRRIERFKVVYAYTVQGETYQKSYPFNQGQQSPSAFVAKHPKGQKFKLYINREAPEQTSFNPVDNYQPMALWILSSLLIGISLLLCCKGVFSWLEDDSKLP